MTEVQSDKARSVDLWTVISVQAEIATVWLRFGDQPNSHAYSVLVPDLDNLSPDDALEATDIVNTLFGRVEALQLVRILLGDPNMGSDHRIVSVQQSGVKTLHRWAWGATGYEFFPFVGWDPFCVRGVDMPLSDLMMAIEAPAR